ncbi:Alpha/Beta hydrolase protein [Globomyces pollinis-pini]|nr:Alpha/Beta hydrolase protein [Globomyces pollinis-pini]
MDFTTFRDKAIEAKATVPEPKFIDSDGISLAYRVYPAKEAKAILLFYHGGGAHSGGGYPILANKLSDTGITVYTPDIRGHGESKGERGDTPSKTQIWKDVDKMIQLVISEQPNLPLFLGGHSSGCGMLLNHSSFTKESNITGYIFLAPQFGFRSKTLKQSESPFAVAKIPLFAFNAMSFGLLFGHSNAVTFNYPDSVLEDKRYVQFNTVEMANALTPSNPFSQFEKINCYGLWIGENDEAIDAQKVVEMQKLNTNGICEIVPKVAHLEIILDSASYIGPFIISKISS